MDAHKIIEAAKHPAFMTSGRDLTVACNRAAERFVGLRRECIVGKPFHQLVETRDAAGTRLGGSSSIVDRARRGEPIPALELYARNGSGELVPVAVGLIVVRGAEPAGDRLIYHLIPRRRRRRTDEVIDRLVGNGSSPSASAPSLTRRERQVLRRLAAGDCTAEIARSLGLSPNTVRGHLKKTFLKLGVHSRAEAVSVALQQHLV